MTQRRSLDELINQAEPVWPSLRATFERAPTGAAILPVDRARASATLLALQVTTRSPLGAMAFEAGGVLIDRGWLRLLAGGGEALRGDLASWNGLTAEALHDEVPGLLIVGHDALGGIFAIDGGALGDARHVFYFAPDSLRWEDLGRGYGDFLHFVCTGDLAKFYGDSRWPGWEADVAALPFDQALHTTPPLWTKLEPGGQRSRRAVAATEVFDLNLDVARQLASVAEGEAV